MEKVFKINKISGQIVEELSIEQFDKERFDKEGVQICGKLNWQNPTVYIGCYMYVYFQSEKFIKNDNSSSSNM